VGLDGPDGSVWGQATVTTPRDPLCQDAASCVAVDVLGDAGESTGVGLGILRGLTTRTDPARVGALRLNHHRIGAVEVERFQVAKAAGGAISVVLSDAWGAYTQQGGRGTLNPWEDWDLYRQFVTDVARWHVVLDQVPDYWEIQNEPDLRQWYPSTTAGQEPTRERVLEQFAVAHDALRAVLPDARIVGPSVSSLHPVPGALVDVPSFLDFAVERGLQVDAISWHELGDDCGGQCNGGPRALAQNVETVRAMLGDRPSLGEPELHVNEFGGRYEFHKPGTAVGYFAALAASGVSKANSACWVARYEEGAYDGCFHDPGTLNSLLLADGTTPIGAWWAWKAYADLQGRLLPASASQPDLSVVSAAEGDTVRVLLGRHTRPGTMASAPAPTVRVAVGPLVRRVTATITVIPHELGPATPVSTSREVRVANGVADLGALDLPTDAAVVVELSGRGLGVTSSTTQLASRLLRGGR
ncbi:MAG: GH39 family glycosyl hydrolase, partial [Actinomycetota bacterium]